jgi:hypothetical protein
MEKCDEAKAELRLKVHPSVWKVAEFMRKELDSRELVAVAQALAVAAPAMWPATPDGWEIDRPMELDIHLTADTPIK